MFFCSFKQGRNQQTSKGNEFFETNSWSSGEGENYGLSNFVLYKTKCPSFPGQSLQGIPR